MTSRNEISYLELGIFNLALAQRELARTPEQVDEYIEIMSKHFVSFNGDQVCEECDCGMFEADLD